MIFDVGMKQLDIDVEKTRAYYEANGENLYGCGGCDGCENFAEAVYAIPESVQHFFRQLGADVGLPAECSTVYAPDREHVCYLCDYYLCGVILGDKEAREMDEAGVWHIKEEFQIHLDESCSICFYEEDSRVFGDGPKPVIVFNVYLTLPWVLEKPNCCL